MTNVREVMQRHVDAGTPGMVWAIVGADGTPEIGAAGNVDRSTIFRIASMSKPITAVAALVLVERCELRLDDPVDDLLPELADRRVLRDPDGDLHDTVAADRPITLRDLLTFRMGLGMDFARWGRQPVLDLLADRGLPIGPPTPQQHPTADEYLALLGSVPLEVQPGERWQYHIGADVLGVLLARHRRTTLEEVLRTLVLDPLGMHDTSFAVPPAKAGRLTSCVTTDGVVWDDVDGQWTAPPRFESGGGGLVSTIDDYLVFATMLRDGGGALLAPSTVELLTTDHLTAEQRRASGPTADGAEGWGFGVSVQAVRVDHANVGTYGWAGGLGTSWFNDPVAGVTTILLTNELFSSAAPPPAHRDLRTCASVAS